MLQNIKIIKNIFTYNTKKRKNLFFVLFFYSVQVLYANDTIANTSRIPNNVIEFANKNGYERPRPDIVWTDIKHGFRNYPEVYRVSKIGNPDKSRYILRNGERVKFSRLLDFYGPKVIIYL